MLRGFDLCRLWCNCCIQLASLKSKHWSRNQSPVTKATFLCPPLRTPCITLPPRVIGERWWDWNSSSPCRKVLAPLFPFWATGIRYEAEPIWASAVVYVARNSVRTCFDDRGKSVWLAPWRRSRHPMYSYVSSGLALSCQMLPGYSVTVRPRPRPNFWCVTSW